MSRNLPAIRERDTHRIVKANFSYIVFLALHAARMGWLKDGKVIDDKDDAK